MAEFRLETDRLLLRDWRNEDIDDFHRLGSDPLVMQTLGPLMSREQTAALIARLQQHAENFGYTFWPVERQQDARVIGWTGLIRSKVPAIEDEIEIGWRLASDCWRQGYAWEAAAAVLEWARNRKLSNRIVAITAEINERSRLLMERLHMVHRPERDFDHPGVAPDNPLQPHVVYEKEL